MRASPAEYNSALRRDQASLLGGAWLSECRALARSLFIRRVSSGMEPTFCARNCLVGGRMACGAVYTAGETPALPGRAPRLADEAEVGGEDGVSG